ncbi:MAG: 16S rRNA (guanine(527)-N(7))-methyltransferase RsmG [Rhodospirillales bacterium]
MAGPDKETLQQFEALAVSRETIRRLEIYADLLIRWNSRINLVSPRTVDDLWQRHILDSLQLLPHIPDTRPVADIGSGAGFPGLMLAIAGIGDVHLIESDQRKCAFLREAARMTGAEVSLHPERVENCRGLEAGVIVSRACAPVAKLLDLGQFIATEKTQCLFLKGQHVDEELTEAHKKWFIEAHRVPSMTDPDGIILKIGAFRHVADRN